MIIIISIIIIIMIIIIIIIIIINYYYCYYCYNNNNNTIYIYTPQSVVNPSVFMFTNLAILTAPLCVSTQGRCLFSQRRSMSTFADFDIHLAPTCSVAKPIIDHPQYYNNKWVVHTDHIIPQWDMFIYRISSLRPWIVAHAAWDICRQPALQDHLGCHFFRDLNLENSRHPRLEGKGISLKAPISNCWFYISISW